MPSFSKKSLRFKITLGGTGRFDDAGGNQIILEGYRASADISLAGGVQLGELRAKIYGVKMSDMNAVTTFNWRVGTVSPSTVIVYAVDGIAESLVFAGNIINAFADFSGAPDVCLYVQAGASFLDVLRAVPPRSYRAPLDVAAVAKEMCASMGLTLENNGVTTQLSDSYYGGTGMAQFKDLANDAGFDWALEGNVMAITPRGTPRGTLVPLISAQTGMLGYPTFDGVYVRVRSIYNPGIQTLGRVKIETEVVRAQGMWKVYSMGHHLESEKPNGAWFTSFMGTTSE